MISVRTLTTLLFAIAVMFGALLPSLMDEYDLPLLFLPFMAYGIGMVLFDVHEAYLYHYLDRREDGHD